MACFTPYLNKEGADVRLSEKFPDWKRNSTRIEIYGTEAMMYVGRMGGGWQVFAAKGKDKKEKIAELVDQDPGYLPDKWHEANFIDCIRSRKLPNGDIEQSHYSTALVHMGNFSTRVGGKHLVFDTKEEKFTNSDEANKLLKLEYRSKYSLSETV